MVLNAELEQHSHIGVLIFQVGENSVKAIASSVERLLRYANYSGSSEAGIIISLFCFQLSAVT